MSRHEATANLKLLLRDLPRTFRNDYTEEANNHLVKTLFYILTGGDQERLKILFRGRIPDPDTRWRLREAQGAEEGAEYTEAARGRPCGHIFKDGEATYYCKTCTADDTCVLCTRCFEASNHVGHQVTVSFSSGTSGCCDCGDPEAWKRPVECTIHSTHLGNGTQAPHSSASQPVSGAFRSSIRTAIGGALDYICDVFSCSPEQMRSPKKEEDIREDELRSRLTPWYGRSTEPEQDHEFVLVLWNDEKHTVDEVEEQVARAARRTRSYGAQCAREVNDVGRCIISKSRNVSDLIHQANILRQIKVTVTIRSARDTFREQMCATIIDWLNDIAGCSVGDDHNVLMHTVCEELLQPWNIGSQAFNLGIGRGGLVDQERTDDRLDERRSFMTTLVMQRRMRAWQRQARQEREQLQATAAETNANTPDEEDSEENDEEDEEEDDDPMDLEDDEVVFQINDGATEAAVTTIERIIGNPNATTLPHPAAQESEESDDDVGRPLHQQTDSSKLFTTIPRVKQALPHPSHPPPPSYWLTGQTSATQPHSTTPGADLNTRVRVDHLVFYDMRMWKTLRNNLRHFYISTVVTVPAFKRTLSLRFAALYTHLAQLYLVADREHDHSIIYLSIQMLTTPSIAEDVVVRSNFFTRLLAILYTFSTKRQVGEPQDVDPSATISSDASNLSNRRFYHVFHDMKYLLEVKAVRAHIRTKPEHMLQFLDFTKLFQGICSNTRAVREHVEFESEAWIHASNLISYVTRLTRQFCDCFSWSRFQDPTDILRAIRQAAKAATISSIGLEADRFNHAHTNDKLVFVRKAGFEYTDPNDPCHDLIVSWQVDKEPMSVWHSLHYTLSWLIDAGKSMSRDQLQSLLKFDQVQLQQQDPRFAQKLDVQAVGTDEWLMAVFDMPLRVCVFLAQIRAGMWVRNGMTMRQQTDYYCSVLQRDVSHQRDLFLIQTAFVVCPPSRFLMTVIDRFSMIEWIRGDYIIQDGFEDHQMLDVAEEFLHLLIIVLSDRNLLLPPEEERNTRVTVAKRDIIHALCFKPLTHSELAYRLTEKVNELENFEEVVNETATFRPPEGLSDSGTFRLRDESFALIDPYYTYYNKSQREEAESVLRSRVAKQTGKSFEESFYEPQLRPIRSGVFSDIAAFSQVPLFVQVIHSFLQYALSAPIATPGIATTRVEALIQVVLHLVLIAVKEDRSPVPPQNGTASFIAKACGEGVSIQGFPKRSIIEYLFLILSEERFNAITPRVRFVLQQLYTVQPETFRGACSRDTSGIMKVEILTMPNANTNQDSSVKKRDALARQARVMASFKQQQEDFMENSNFDWGDTVMGDSDEDTGATAVVPTKTWEVPGGTCILCQEETSETRLHGTLAFVTDNRFFRVTNWGDEEHIREVQDLPPRLDQSLENVRASASIATSSVKAGAASSDGRASDTDQKRRIRGFPSACTRSGQVFSGCGHVMHFSCFQDYWSATCRRHQAQHSRNHPERLERKEFVCPLCKALGNAFMPTSWRPQAAVDPSAARPQEFLAWMEQNAGGRNSNLFYLTSGHRYVDMLKTEEESTRIRTGIWPPSTPTGLGQVQTAQMLELIKAYRRLVDTVNTNKFQPQTLGNSENLQAIGTINACIKALGNSIGAVEIAHRGHASSGVFLNSISPQIVTQLRTLSETIATFGSLSGAGVESLDTSVNGVPSMGFLAGLCPENTHGDSTPLFSEDILGSLAKSSFFMGDIPLKDFFQVVRIHYVAEIVKCVFAAVRHGSEIEQLTIDGAVGGHSSRSHSQGFSALVQRIVNLYWSHDSVEAMLSSVDENPNDRIGFDLFVRSLVASYALPFARKCALLLHVRFGVDFEDVNQDYSDKPSELEALSGVLHLPSIDELLASLQSSEPGSKELNHLVDQWIGHWLRTWCNSDRGLPLDLGHPALYELVELPHTHDTLNAIAVSRRCPTTGGPVQDPCVCLLCGDIFCGQATCCLLNDEGGCTRHVQKCGGNVGMFFDVRKCVVLLKHYANGSFFVAPYLDKHGETDLNLKRHQQLFLNQNRYDRLFRDVWLGFNGGIASAVARKLESVHDTGGWETI